jgi:hypothetical protein
MVLFVLAAIALVLLVGAGHVVANRGGAPASAPRFAPPITSRCTCVQAGRHVVVDRRALPRSHAACRLRRLVGRSQRRHRTQSRQALTLP